MPNQRCMGVLIIFQYSIGLPGTYNTLIGGKGGVSTFPNCVLDQKENVFQLIHFQIYKIRRLAPLKLYFSVKQPLTFYPF